MSNNKSSNKKQNTPNPWAIDADIKRKVKSLLQAYYKISAKATQTPSFNIQIEDFIRYSSPSNMSDTGGPTNRISRPTEDAAIRYSSAKLEQARKIEEAIQIKNAIDSGIEEASKYMRRPQKRKLLVYVLRRVLLDGKTLSNWQAGLDISNDLILSEPTLSAYREKAMFFIAVFLGLISEEEVISRNLPKKEADIPLISNIDGEPVTYSVNVWEEDPIPEETKELWKKTKAQRE